MMGLEKFIFQFIRFPNFMGLVAMALQIISSMSELLQNKLIVAVHAKHIQLAMMNGAKSMSSFFSP